MSPASGNGARFFAFFSSSLLVNRWVCDKCVLIFFLPFLCHCSVEAIILSEWRKVENLKGGRRLWGRGDDAEGKEDRIADESNTLTRSEIKTDKLLYNAFHVNLIARKLSTQATVRSTLCAIYDYIDIQLGFYVLIMAIYFLMRFRVVFVYLLRVIPPPPHALLNLLHKNSCLRVFSFALFLPFSSFSCGFHANAPGPRPRRNSRNRCTRNRFIDILRRPSNLITSKRRKQFGEYVE